MDQWRPLAAADNAAWCDVVCRSHGARGRFDDDAWTCPTRTPPLYPDAVTLVARPSVRALLARIDISAGCSIKDSFASLDLSDHGFRVLFEAQWVVRTEAERAAEATDLDWVVVRRADDLVAWEKGWQGEEGASGIFRADMLGHEALAVLAGRREDRVVAGAVLHRSETVVGISNFFAARPIVDAAWSGCLALADSLFPGSSVVGYESGEALAAARRHGFESAGPLRVWIKDD